MLMSSTAVPTSKRLMTIPNMMRLRGLLKYSLIIAPFIESAYHRECIRNSHIVSCGRVEAERIQVAPRTSEEDLPVRDAWRGINRVPGVVGIQHRSSGCVEYLKEVACSKHEYPIDISHRRDNSIRPHACDAACPQDLASSRVQCPHRRLIAFASNQCIASCLIEPAIAKHTRRNGTLLPPSEGNIGSPDRTSREMIAVEGIEIPVLVDGRNQWVACGILEESGGSAKVGGIGEGLPLWDFINAFYGKR